MINLRSLEKPWLMVTAASLLATGLVVDLAFTQPKIDELQQLKQQQDEIHVNLGRAMKNRQDRAELLRFMEEHQLPIEAPETDPAAYLGEMVEASALERLELRATDNSEGKNLRRSQFFLRVLGKFDPTLDFIRTLEQAPRLVVVDAIKIEPGSVSSSLETRLNLSIYDPKGEI